MKEINRTIIPIKIGHEPPALCWHANELVVGIILYNLTPANLRQAVSALETEEANEVG